MREADFSRTIRPGDRAETATGAEMVFAKGIVCGSFAETSGKREYGS
jgi:hypothetical protein